MPETRANARGQLTVLAGQLTEVAVLVTKKLDFLSLRAKMSDGSMDKDGVENVTKTVIEGNEG